MRLGCVGDSARPGTGDLSKGVGGRRRPNGWVYCQRGDGVQGGNRGASDRERTNGYDRREAEGAAFRAGLESARRHRSAECI